MRKLLAATRAMFHPRLTLEPGAPVLTPVSRKSTWAPVSGRWIAVPRPVPRPPARRKTAKAPSPPPAAKHPIHASPKKPREAHKPRAATPAHPVKVHEPPRREPLAMPHRPPPDLEASGWFMPPTHPETVSRFGSKPRGPARKPSKKGKAAAAEKK